MESLNLPAIARAIHVMGVVLWIGGVAFVTTVLLPSARGIGGREGAAAFATLENRFAPQARVVVLVTGLSGFYLLDALHGWGRYASLHFWWVHAMTAIWTLFALMLFVLEPFVLHKWFDQMANQDPEGTLRRAQRMHWILLVLSLITVGATVAAVHGQVF